MVRNLQIKIIEQSDIDAVVKIHLRALPNDVLPNLGGKILQAYYSNILLDEQNILFGAKVSGRLVGFCLVSTINNGLINFLMSRHGIFALVRLFVLKPYVFISGCLQAYNKNNIFEECAEIVYIAVDPRHHRRGIGFKMILHASKLVSQRGCSYLQTKTANRDLKKFYVEKLDAKEIKAYRVMGNDYSVLKWHT